MGVESLSTVVLSVGIDMVPSIIDVWGYDREICSSSSSSSSSTRVTQKPGICLYQFWFFSYAPYVYACQSTILSDKPHCLQTNQYDVAHIARDMYISTK